MLMLRHISIFSVTEFETFRILYLILCLRCHLQIILELLDQVDLFRFTVLL